MEIPICEANGEGGIFFPSGGEWELNISRPVRGFLYAAGMLYLFLGISIIADRFMGSIEKVTSRRIRRKIGGGHGFRTVLFWNPTVATLSLMALGSSAPEIFLSIIDTIKKRFHFGTLGPATIVGSASFNLFVIIAVCIVVIPSDEVRAIHNLPAFYITASFSVIAYLWMAFILLVTSRDVVEVWEAAVTFLLFFILIYVSYKVDKGCGSGLLRRFGILGSAEEDDAELHSAGYFVFEQHTAHVAGSEESQVLRISVNRSAAKPEALGEASCTYRTFAMSAVPGYDYEELSGTIKFAPGEVLQQIEVRTLGKEWRLRECAFLFMLEDAEGDARFNPDDDGGEESAIMTITLGAFGTAPSAFARCFDAVIGADLCRKAAEDWRDQFIEVWYCNGSAEEQAEASVSDWIMHVVSFPWNFALVSSPPLCLNGGWACFFFSLGVIGLMTAAVSDLAELFGCVMGVPDIITAITVVALGTSMPDLFASLTAAKEDPTADASIVNVTGSNSVNVFLGLGVPWTIAAVYWTCVGRTAEWEATYPEVAARISGGAFVVEAGDFGFSVLTFCYACFLALLLLHARRKFLKAELGGPRRSKIASGVALMTYWVGWVCLVSAQVLRWSGTDASVGEFVGVLLLAIAVSVVVTAVPLWLMTQEADKTEPSAAYVVEEGVKDPLSENDSAEVSWPSWSGNPRKEAGPPKPAVFGMPVGFGPAHRRAGAGAPNTGRVSMYCRYLRCGVWGGTAKE